MAGAGGPQAPPTSNDRLPRVAVIGAGVAGLSAAQSIFKAEEGPAVEVAVFEASNRIGGRIHTCNFGKSFIEKGAAWVHGYSPENPLYSIAIERQLGPSHERAPMYERTALEQRREDGESVPISGYLPLERLFNSILDDPKCPLRDVIRKEFKGGDKLYKNCLNGDSSEVISCPVSGSVLGECIYPTLASILSHASEDGESKDSDWPGFFQQLVSEELIGNGCSSLYDVDVDGENEYVELPGGNVALDRGYGSLIESLASEIPAGCLHLNHPVEKIEWLHQLDGHPPVRLHFKDGTTYEADVVLVTVSLGYLKHHAGQLFDPPLPEGKLEAIRNLGFGTVNKIQLQYDEPFWSPDWKGVHLLWNNESVEDLEGRHRPKDEWFKRIAYFRPSWYNEDVLETLVPGLEGEHLESLDTSEVEAVVTGILRQFLANPDIPEPDRLIVTKWSSEPYIRGSYSYIAAKASIEDTKRLAEPVMAANDQGSMCPRICFAGEATSRQFYSTVHGALLSGRREAERIMEFARSACAPGRTEAVSSQ